MDLSSRNMPWRQSVEKLDGFATLDFIYSLGLQTFLPNITLACTKNARTMANWNIGKPKYNGNMKESRSVSARQAWYQPARRRNCPEPARNNPKLECTLHEQDYLSNAWNGDAEKKAIQATAAFISRFRLSGLLHVCCKSWIKTKACPKHWRVCAAPETCQANSASGQSWSSWNEAPFSAQHIYRN